VKERERKMEVWEENVGQPNVRRRKRETRKGSWREWVEHNSPVRPGKENKGRLARMRTEREGKGGIGEERVDRTW